MLQPSEETQSDDLHLRTVSGLIALAISYVSSFVATIFLLAPFTGLVWSAMIAIGGAFIGLLFLALATLGLLMFHRSAAEQPGAWCIAAPPAITAAWLAMDYGFRHRPGDLPFATYLTTVAGSWPAMFVFATASMAAATFYVVEPRVRRRIAQDRRKSRA